jgi:hypothetical protein
MSVFAWVQSTSTTSSETVAFATNVTAGNLLVVVTGGYNSDQITAVTDSLGNTYTQLGEEIFGATGGISLWYTVTASSGTNTATASLGALSNLITAVGEYTAPVSFLISRDGYITTDGFTANYTIKFPFDSKGTPTTVTEIMCITLWFDAASPHSWTMSNGTKRIDANPGGSTSFLYGDYDTTTSPLSTVITGMVNAYTSFGLTMFLILPGVGAGGGVILGDMSAGMRG